MLNLRFIGRFFYRLRKKPKHAYARFSVSLVYRKKGSTRLESFIVVAENQHEALGNAMLANGFLDTGYSLVHKSVIELRQY